MNTPFVGKPDFVNEEGTKWWINEALTSYVQNKNTKNKSIICYYVETKYKHRSMVLVDHSTGKIIEDDQTIEGMGTKIDIRNYLLNS